METCHKKLKLLLLTSLILPLLAGCAGYPQRMAAMKQDFVLGDYEAALSKIDDDDCKSGDDQLLCLLERATIKQNKGDFEGSNRDFEAAYNVIRDYESRPSVSVRDMSSEVGAALYNETTLAYKGYGYEKFLIHIYKAINYLMLGDLEGAGVEIRRLDERRKIEVAEHKRALGDASEAAHEQDLQKDQLSDISGQIIQAYGPAYALAESVSNLYLSAFGSYLSSLHYDLDGSYSEALIDCRRVIAQAPGFESARIDAVSYGADDINSPPVKLDLAQRGDLLLFFQCGLSPVKREIFIPIPTGDGWLSVAFPVYQTVPTKLEEAVVYIDGRRAGSTGMLSNIEAKQIRNLVDQIPVMIVRQAVRVIIKGVVLHQAGKEAGVWGELAMSLYNTLSEQADLRSWLLLPQNIQALRLYPPEGEHTVRIDIT
ncbi:MAG: hypothetical protein U9N73_01950, partial [Candidatus Auribacterota bacterium]|nr:hypothetical protein [Candidatus Auribacterota bacterium]